MTPFAALGHPELEKEALAKGVSKSIGWVGDLIRRSGGAAKANAGRKVFNELGGRQVGKANQQAMKSLTAGASNAVGNKRMAMAGRFQNASKAINSSPGLQKAINYGGGGALALGGLYGANRLGHSSGVDAGIEQGLGMGVDAGMEAGVEAAMANQAANQPGYLGGLWNALKGEPAPGMNAGNVYGALAARRQALINQLMGARIG